MNGSRTAIRSRRSATWLGGIEDRLAEGCAPGPREALLHALFRQNYGCSLPVSPGLMCLGSMFCASHRAIRLIDATA